MAKVTFKQFLGKYGIRMLFVSSENIYPGIALQPDKQGFFKYDDLYKAFGETEDQWTSGLQQANLITGTITRSLSLNGRSSLDEFGISIDGGLSRTSKVTFKISDIKAQTLTLRTRADIETAIDKMKKSDKSRYKRYAGKIALDQTFYASNFTAEFDVAANVDLRSEIENRIKLAAGAEIKWASKKSFQIASNAAVPFGFAGIKF